MTSSSSAAGAAGISVASSLLARASDLDIAIIDPQDVHYYQPGWTMVGGGIFEPEVTARTMGSLIPRGVHWIKAAVSAFEPANNALILDGCRVVRYNRLIVAPGPQARLGRVEGLPDTLGRNGVTSNYRYDLAPYTWKLVKGMKSGKAIFTQPPMPIKCAGAPQKALYLSGDHWYRRRSQGTSTSSSAMPAACSSASRTMCPPLKEYIDSYNADLNFMHNLRPSTARRKRPGSR
jgi:sulfide:quinone oxidoreductase